MGLTRFELVTFTDSKQQINNSAVCRGDVIPLDHRPAASEVPVRYLYFSNMSEITDFRACSKTATSMLNLGGF